MEKKLRRQRIINIILVIALIVGFVQFKDFKTETVTAIEDNETILDKDGNILCGEK